LPISAAALPADATICRNCGAAAANAYCPSCGQETDTRLPTVRQFMRDATGRLIAFDGRLRRTLFALVAKPGFLIANISMAAGDAISGRRAYGPYAMFVDLA
jgi:hypothetical protein